MGGLRPWVVAEWRRDWRALVWLALLIAFGGAITIAAVAGGRRAQAAFPEFLDRTSAPISVTLAGQSDDLSLGDDVYAIADDMAAVPGVEGVRPVSWMGVAPAANGAQMETFASAFRRGVGERPPEGLMAVRGRLPDPAVASEVAVNEAAADFLGVGVGDQVVLNTYAPEQIQAMVSGRAEAFRGPRVTADVVGVVRTAEDVSDNSEPVVTLSDAFRVEYGDRVANCDCEFWVRTAPDDVAAVSAALPATFSGYPLLVEQVDSRMSARVDGAVGLEVGALRIAAIIGAVAAMIVVAQAMARHIGAERGGSATLTALGATRRDVVRSWVVVLGPAALAGAVGAALGAVALSPLFPRGLARAAIVDPGVSVDVPALVGGAIAVVAVSLALAYGAALLSVKRNGSRRARRSAATVGAPALVTRPTVALGANLAVDPGRDRARLAAVSAVCGLALAVGGAVAVSLIELSADEVLRTPQAFAADWDLQMMEPPDDESALIEATAAEPIAAFAISTRVGGNSFTVSGPDRRSLASPGSLQPIVGWMGPFVDRGRTASTADDVVLGKALADRLGVDLGDRVTIDTGELGLQAYVVSGIGRLSDGDETDMAFYVTPEGLQRMHGPGEPAVDGAYVRLGEVDDEVRERLVELGWGPVVPPSRVANLAEVGSVPRLLAVALAALGLGGMTHALLVARRRRTHDLAVANAVGFTRGQLASTVRWQGLLTAGAAIVVGLPVGALVGRVVWKEVAGGVGALDLVSVPWATLVAVPAIVVLVVGGVASAIGHRTARLDTARVLRGE